MNDRQFPSGYRSESDPRRVPVSAEDGVFSPQRQLLSVNEPLPKSDFERFTGLDMFKLFGGRAISKSK